MTNEITSQYFKNKEVPDSVKIDTKKSNALAKYKEMLKVQSCKLYNNKYLIALTKLKKTEIFVFIAVLAFKLLSRKVLFINRKEDNRNC